MMTEDIPGRVRALEMSVTAIGADVKDLRGEIGGMGGKLDKLVDSLTQTDGRVAERAQAVKLEIREEGDRKARDRSELFKSALALFGAIGLVVTAFGGPYLSKLDATSTGQHETTTAVAAVREMLAQQGADVARNRDALDATREWDRRQNDRVWDLNTRLARIEGARGGNAR